MLTIPQLMHSLPHEIESPIQEVDLACSPACLVSALLYDCCHASGVIIWHSDIDRICCLLHQLLVKQSMTELCLPPGHVSNSPHTSKLEKTPGGL